MEWQVAVNGVYSGAGKTIPDVPYTINRSLMNQSVVDVATADH